MAYWERGKMESLPVVSALPASAIEKAAWLS